MNLRQIKKHIHAQPQTVRLDAGPGWRAVLEEELRSVLDTPVQAYKFQPEVVVDDEGITVANLDFRQLLELPLRLATAMDIFWQIATKHVGSFGEYEDFIKGIDWGYFLPQGAPVRLKVVSYRSALYHEGKLEKMARAALEQQGYAEKNPQFQLRIEQKENRATAYLSLTVDPIYRRGYKTDLSHPAPLQEHLAAAAIHFAARGRKPDAIIVPFAGSGTLVMESWLYCARPSLDLWRKFTSVEALPELPDGTWNHIHGKLLATGPLPRVIAIENDGQGADILARNLAFAEQAWPSIKDSWQVETSSFEGFTPSPDAKSIFIPMNPPYGIRLNEDVTTLYNDIGKWLRHSFQTDQTRYGFIFVADSKAYHAFEKGIGMEFVDGIQSFSQGGQHIRCVRFTIAGK